MRRFTFHLGLGTRFCQRWTCRSSPEGSVGPGIVRVLQPRSGDALQQSSSLARMPIRENAVMLSRRLADGRAGIDASLVGRLVASQFPQWTNLAVTPVEPEGWDNRTYRLGDNMSVRLPTADGYVAAVAKEYEWLPHLGPSLPLPIPATLGIGQPGEGYPYPWSVRSWLRGEPADRAHIHDEEAFATSLGRFIIALQKCDAADGPAAGAHCWYRGRPPQQYDAETRQCLVDAASHIDASAAEKVWDRAIASEWLGPSVWFHGDVAPGNLLVEDGKLSAVIDFGTCGVGDPACDLAIAWTWFSGASREAFRRTVTQDGGTWARARGWALWKTLLLLKEAASYDQRAKFTSIVNDIVANDLAA